MSGVANILEVGFNHLFLLDLTVDVKIIGDFLLKGYEFSNIPIVIPPKFYFYFTKPVILVWLERQWAIGQLQDDHIHRYNCGWRD